MRYLSFEIKDYRAITGPLTIDLKKQSLFPIVGINESGKTTILQAILAFDRYADETNGGRHLLDVNNLYRTSPGTPTVTAKISCTSKSLIAVLDEVEEGEVGYAAMNRWRRKHSHPSTLTVVRDLRTKRYSVKEAPFSNAEEQDAFCRILLAHVPYILYFDDFRDKVDERIVIPASEDANTGGWASIAEQLFRRTEPALSIWQLAKMEERQRKSVLAKVQRHLNKTLTSEWQNFRLDDADALEIALTFEPDPSHATGGALKLELVERDANGDAHFFFISDRSKGFFWFFNFVMKLEFNPKVLSTDDQGSIYLLDEPGSYLHATAQTKLCSKLKSLSKNNIVMYCTHSHYLLNPEMIPLSTIRVADKDGNGSITLIPLDRYEGSIAERRSAFQPVVDALQIKPFVVDLTHSRAILVEGIYDYYSLELFRNNRPIGVIPSVGADSLKYYVSLLIAWQVKFRALWDNDETGRSKHDAARKLFGDELATRAFRLLPTNTQKEKRIIQNLFDGRDLRMFRAELDLNENTSFEGTIAAVFYSDRRAELTNMCSAETHKAFASVWEILAEGL